MEPYWYNDSRDWDCKSKLLIFGNSSGGKYSEYRFI